MPGVDRLRRMAGSFCTRRVSAAVVALVLSLGTGCIDSRPGTLGCVDALTRGLAGRGLVLMVNGRSEAAITENSRVALACLAEGTPYAVSVKTQPSDPLQTCSVSNGEGTARPNGVDTVEVSCSTRTFTIRVVVAGVGSGGVVVQNNGSDDVAVAQDGSFEFSQPVPDGASYAVSARPLSEASDPSRTCVVADGEGVVAGRPVVVHVDCLPERRYAIRGTVTGLAGAALVLRTEGLPDLTIPSKGKTFAFVGGLVSGTAYDVHIAQQPTNPQQLCRMVKASGVVDSADVVDVDVSCTTVVAVGDNRAATSRDGVSWVVQSIPFGSYYAVSWNGSVFAAVGTNVAATSRDGVRWEATSIPTGNYRAIVWAGRQFIAVGDNGQYDAACATSADGTAWGRCMKVGGRYLSIAWNGSMAVAVGAGGSNAFSYDGITWSHPGSSWSSLGASGIVWAGSRFVVVGAGGTWLSTDGVTWWTHNPTAADRGLGLAWNGAVLASVGASKAATSLNGDAWTPQLIPSADYQCVHWTGLTFVAVGQGGAAAVSTDGVSWVSSAISLGDGNYYGVTSSVLYP